MPAVSLHLVTRDDGPDLIRAHVESRVHHWPWTYPFTDAPGFNAWFARLDPERMISLIARHVPTRGVIGLCTVSEIVRGGFESAYLGFHGMSAFARQGLMTEAVRLTVRYAFDVLKLHRLEANIQPENLASLALVQRAGFRKEGYSRDYLKIGGTWKDHERWAILAGELE